jgi:hypothetical protein
MTSHLGRLCGGHLRDGPLGWTHQRAGTYEVEQLCQHCLNLRHQALRQQAQAPLPAGMLVVPAYQ